MIRTIVAAGILGIAAYVVGSSPVQGGMHSVSSLARLALDRQDAIKNVWVSYDVDYEFFTDAQSVKQRYVQVPYTVTFGIMDERRYMSKEPKDKSDRKRTAIFDGIYTLKLHNSGVSIGRGKDLECENLERYCLSALQMPYPDEFRTALQGKWFFPENLRQAQLVNLSLYSVRDSPELIDGAMCEVLEADGRDIVWIDPMIGGAIRRRERFESGADGSPRRRETIELKDYTETTSGIWVPLKAEFTRFGLKSDSAKLRDQPVMKEILTVSEVKVNSLTKDDFAVAVKPGMRVFTREGDFRVPGNDEEVLNDFAQILVKAGSSVQSPHRIWLIVAANIAVVLLVAGIYWRRAFLSKIMPSR